MKIKLFFSTWNNENRINTTFNSLLNSNIDLTKLDIYVINNHSNFKIKNEYRNLFTLINNETRPDWSSGHLSRSWNQALLHGFKDLNNPDADIVITCQDDTIFKPNWLNNLIELHKKYEFIQNGHGDCFCSYTPEHVKKVGLWDERFCGISRQASDYFTRCLMYNREKTSINDPGHKRFYNPIFSDLNQSTSHLVVNGIRGIFGDNTYPNNTNNTENIAKKLIEKKYGYVIHELSSNTISKLPKHTLIENYVYYPYFEKNIYQLKEKNYLW